MDEELMYLSEDIKNKSLNLLEFLSKEVNNIDKVEEYQELETATINLLNYLEEM